MKLDFWLFLNTKKLHNNHEREQCSNLGVAALVEAEICMLCTVLAC